MTDQEISHIRPDKKSKGNQPANNRFDKALTAAMDWFLSLNRTTFLLALAMLLSASTVLRILMISKIDRPGRSVWAVLWGLPADLPLACAAAYVLARLSKAKGWSAFICLPLGILMLFFIGFWNALQFFYFEEFHARPDQIFVDYIVYTAEVTGAVWEDYPAAPVLAVLFLGAVVATVLLRRSGRSRPRPRPGPQHPDRRAVMLKLAAGAGILFCMVWFVSLQLFPFKIKTLTEVADNGTIRLLRAVRTGTLDFHTYYAYLPDQAALEEARRYLSEDPQFVKFEDNGLQHLRSPSVSGHRPGARNVVLIISESLGMELVGGLSPNGCRLQSDQDPGPTPRLHEYLGKGLFFPRTYATGTRTARGMEAVLCSLPPVPGPAIFKRHSLGEIDSIADILSGNGYETVFLYGGGLAFDNMDEFLPQIGFSRLVGFKQIEEQLSREAFRTSWGFADEFVFDQAMKEMVRLRDQERPFFLTILTLSNHSPFTFPEGRVGFENGTRPGALAYSDYALGRFLDQAEAAGFFENTLFAIIADHGPRAYLSEQLPLDAHRVVFALLGAGVSEYAGRCDLRRISNMDVAPTVLGILGISYQSAFFGHDVLAGSPRTYVFVQDKRDVGFVSDDQLAVIGFQREDGAGTLDAEDNPHEIRIVGTEHPLVRQGTALLQAAYGMQKGKW